MQSSCQIRLSWLAGLLVLLAAPATWAQQAPAASTNTQPPASKEANANPSQFAYLGVEVDSLHPSLASHLPSTLTHGQGVLVVYVEPGSPAEKAGLKEHDVITSYDDQKLFAPEQLAKLVQADKPQRDVALGIVRNGKGQQLKVTLASEPADYRFEGPRAGWEPRMPGEWNWGFPEQPVFRNEQRRNGDAAWESFDSLTLNKIGDHKFKVAIQYLDKAGKKQQHTFEGTRDEIRRDIEAEKDLPANERGHLLSSLGMSSGEDRSARFPMWDFGPWGRAR